MPADHDPSHGHAALPDSSRLLRELDLRTPVIGLYDAPDPEAFAPLVSPPKGPGRGPCLFDYYKRWVAGETLHLTAEAFGCGGCGRSLFGVQVRERDDFIDFLWKDEGLRASRELMADWVDNAPTYHPEHANVLVGPLKPELAGYLKSVTFWVNADQLCVLQHGAYHHHAWGEPDPVSVPFGSGCSELVVQFPDLSRAHAMTAAPTSPCATACRRACSPSASRCRCTSGSARLGNDSYFGKGFLARLRKARGGSLA